MTQLFFFCYDTDFPTGGQYETYRHVDILNANKFTAFVVHQNKDFRISWFENDTRIISMEECRSICREDDYFAVPETEGANILQFPGRKVIFNKNLYWGFECFGLNSPEVYPYHHPAVVAAIVMSEHNQAQLQFAFPKLKTFLVQSGIDTSMYKYVPLAQKAREIAFVAKARTMVTSVLHTAWARGRSADNALSSFKLTIIEGVPMAVEASILQRSVSFVFLSLEEGRPRMVLEAMACGCIVPGFAAGPMVDCLLPELRFEPGNIMSIVGFLEELAETLTTKSDKWNSLARAGTAFASHFSVRHEEESVLAAWNGILAI